MNGHFISFIEKRKFFFIYFLTIIILNVFILISIRLYPFIDLPFRLAVATIYKYYTNTDYLFSEYYLIPSIFKSNIFYTLFVTNSIFGNAEFGNKVFYIVYLILFPLSVYFLIKYIKGNIWYALLSFLFIYNHNCHWGFADYMFSVPIIIFGLIFLIEQFKGYKLYYAPLNFLFIIFIFFIHFQAALFFILIFGLINILYFNKQVKYRILNLFIAFVITIIMYVVYKLDSSDAYIDLKDYLINYYINYYPLSLLKRIQIIFINDNYHWAEEPIGSIIASLVSVILFLPFLMKLINEKKFHFKLNKELSNDFILKIFIIVSIALYFILPEDMPGQNIIYQRFSIFIWLGIIALSSKIELRENELRKFKTILLIFILFFNLMIFEYFISFNQTIKEFTPEIFSGLKNTDKVYGLFFDPYYRGRPVFIHYHNYYTIWNKGISGGFVDYRFSFIKRKTDLNRLPTHNPWAGNLENYNNDYTDVEYLLCRAKDKDVKINDFRLVRCSGYWLLFKNSKMNNK